MPNRNIQTQIKTVGKILKDNGLLKEANHFLPNYSSCGRAYYKNMTYKQMWDDCYINRRFNFLLIDDSILQFISNEQNEDLSFIFIECPYKQPSDMKDDNTYVDDMGYSDQEIKDHFLPIRYDYNIKLYNEGLHPAAHLHFGVENSLRIGTRKQLSPISFLLFIIRQCYPLHWRKIVDNKNNEFIFRDIKIKLCSVDVKFLEGKNKFEMMLE